MFLITDGNLIMTVLVAGFMQPSDPRLASAGPDEIWPINHYNASTSAIGDYIYEHIRERDAIAMINGFGGKPSSSDKLIIQNWPEHRNLMVLFEPIAGKRMDAIKCEVVDGKVYTNHQSLTKLVDDNMRGLASTQVKFMVFSHDESFKRLIQTLLMDATNWSEVRARLLGTKMPIFTRFQMGMASTDHTLWFREKVREHLGNPELTLTELNYSGVPLDQPLEKVLEGLKTMNQPNAPTEATTKIQAITKRVKKMAEKKAKR